MGRTGSASSHQPRRATCTLNATVPAKACRAFAELRGWRVTDVFEDVDLSAYQPRVNRPAYEALLDALKAGRLDGVLVWKLDRLVRRPAEFERFWSICETAGAVLASATEPIDTSHELGLALVRILVTFAHLESATISVRIKAKNRELAEAGNPPGGPAPYGFGPHMATLVEPEATLLREAAQRILDGDTLNGICRDWRDRGVRTRNDLPFAPASLRYMLCAPRLVGDRTHLGVVAARDCWPAILDRRTAAGVRAVFADHSRRAPYMTKKYLLTGFLRCGRCGMRMHGRARSRRPSYGCPANRAGGCNTIWCVAPPLEDYVVDQVLAHLEHTVRAPPPTARPPSDDEMVAALEEHTQAMTALSRQRFVDRSLSARDFTAAGLALAAEFHHRTHTVLPEANTAIATPALTGTARASWPELDLRQHKGVIGSVLQYAVIEPIGQANGARFRPERVTLHWWDERGEETSEF